MISDNIKNELKKLAVSASPEIHNFMKEIANRGREPNAGETKVDDLEQCGLSRQQAVEFFKGLETALSDDNGSVSFKAGRRGKPSRLNWGNYRAIEVANCFVSALENGRGAPDQSGAPSSNVPSSGIGVESHRHSFLLRPGVTVFVELPLNVTSEEVNRLADFIRTTSF